MRLRRNGGNMDEVVVPRNGGAALLECFDAAPGAVYLVRPDQHLCARWRRFDAAAVARAYQRALQG